MVDLFEDEARRQSGCELVGHLGAADDVAAVLRGTSVDAVVFGHGNPDVEGRVRALICEFPLLKVLSLSEERNELVVYMLQPSAFVLGEVSIREILRAMTGPGWPGHH